MYGYIYLITNLINNRKYIGQHKSKTFDKNYWGSGKIISQAILKEGKENFSRDILEWCETKEDLDNAEIKWISFYDAQKSPDFYNIGGGGEGNKEYIFTESQKRKLKNVQLNRVRMHKGNIEKNPKKGSKEEFDLLQNGFEYGFSPNSCRSSQYKGKNPMFGLYGKDNPNYGSKRTEEQRKHISDACKGRPAWNKGKEGTAKGSKWYHNPETKDCKMIKDCDIEKYESLGYIKGRIKK